MKLIFLSALLFSISATANEVGVSPTFTVSFPFEKAEKTYLSSMNSVLISGSEDKATFQVLIARQTPPTLANEFSVKRYWDKTRKQTKSFDKNEQDMGCKKSTTRLYVCDRTVSQDGKFVYEKLVWNARNDLVLLRTSSFKSNEFVTKIAAKFETRANSRLPAGAKK